MKVNDLVHAPLEPNNLVSTCISKLTRTYITVDFFLCADKHVPIQIFNYKPLLSFRKKYIFKNLKHHNLNGIILGTHY